MEGKSKERFHAKASDVLKIYRKELLPALQAELDARKKREQESLELLPGSTKKFRQAAAKERAVSEIAGPTFIALRREVERANKLERVVEERLVQWDERVSVALISKRPDSELKRLREEGRAIRENWKVAGKKFDRLATRYNTRIKSMSLDGRSEKILKRTRELIKRDERMRQTLSERRQKLKRLVDDIKRVKQHEKLLREHGDKVVLLEKRSGEKAPRILKDKEKKVEQKRARKKELKLAR